MRGRGHAASRIVIIIIVRDNLDGRVLNGDNGVGLWSAGSAAGQGAVHSVHKNPVGVL